MSVTSSAGTKTLCPRRPRCTTIPWKMSSWSDPSMSKSVPTCSPSELRTGVSCRTPRHAIGCSGSRGRSGSVSLSAIERRSLSLGDTCLVLHGACRAAAPRPGYRLELERRTYLTGVRAPRIDDGRRRQLPHLLDRRGRQHAELDERRADRDRAGTVGPIAFLVLAHQAHGAAHPVPAFT